MQIRLLLASARPYRSQDLQSRLEDVVKKRRLNSGSRPPAKRLPPDAKSHHLFVYKLWVTGSNDLIPIYQNGGHSYLKWYKQQPLEDDLENTWSLS